MKNIDETIQTVSDRIGQYHAKQKRRKDILVRTLTPLCCLCIIAVLGFAVWGDNQTPDMPQFTMEEPVTVDTVNNTIPVTTHPPKYENKIIINKVDSISIDRSKMNICLHVDDFVPMTDDEINSYYGINVFPTVPEDISAWEEQGIGLYKRDGGTGEVYWDSIVLNYDNENFTRSVNIEIDKGHLPVTCYAFFESLNEKSLINGTEVAIGLSEGGYYHVEFIYQDVGFRLIANGITEDELISIISSLIV